MFKKTLITAALVFSFALAPIAFADTASDLQVQINAILAQIKVLQAAINSQLGNPSTTPVSSGVTVPTANTSAAGEFCYNFTKPLRIGDQNNDVTNLDRALIKEGFLSQDQVFQDARTVLNFDEVTASAVVGFQEKYASEILTPNGLTRGTGFVGASTRAKLNQLYGCGNITPPVVVNPTQPPQVCGPGALYSSVTGLPCSSVPPTSTTCPSNQTLNATGQCVITTAYNPATDASVSATVVNSFDDHAGTQGNFNGGGGIVGSAGNADWNLAMSLTLGSAKKIKSIGVYHTGSGAPTYTEGWSTAKTDDMGRNSFPLVVFQNNSQLNTAYDQIIGTLRDGSYQFTPGTYQFVLYGQVETPHFYGGKVVVNFTDGTQTTGAILASSYVPPTTTNTTQPWLNITYPTPNPAITINSGTSLNLVWQENYNSSLINVSIYDSSGKHFYDGKTSGVIGNNTQTLPPEATNLPNGQYGVAVSDPNKLDSNGHALSSGVIFNVSNNTTTQPSIHIVALANGHSDSSVTDSLSVNVGDTFTISGTPQNLQGMSYYYGNGYPTSGYYSRAYFFDQTFGNNNSCGNNEAPATGVWTMTCTAKVSGSSAIYVEIYANGQTYRSNKVNVTISTTSTQPSITVLSPNGGESWQEGRTYQITWSVSNLQGGQSIKLVNSNNSIIRTIASNIAGGSYSWTLPQEFVTEASPGNFKILISSTDNTVSDYSDNFFRITYSGMGQPSITVLSPNGGESYVNSSTINVSYYGVNVLGGLHVYLYNSTVGKSIYSTGVSATRNTGNGLISLDLSSKLPRPGQYQIMVCDENTTNSSSDLGGPVCGTSRSYITITAPIAQPSITVLSPNGGETITLGTPTTITWSGGPFPNGVTVGLLTGDSTQSNRNQIGWIGSATAGVSQLNWDGKTICAGYNGAGVNGTNGVQCSTVNPGIYKILLTAFTGSGNITVEDLSNSYFTITAPTATTQKTLNGYVDSSVIGISATAGSTNVPIFSLKLSASGGDVNIGGLQISANPGMVEGVSAKVVHLKIYDGATMVATAGAPTLESDGTTMTYPFTFSSTIPNSVSKLYTVRADITTNASGAIKFGLTGINHSYGSALTVPVSSFSWGNNINISATPTMTPIPTVTITASTLNTFDDKAGTWYQFYPSKGSSGLSVDWNWNLQFSFNGSASKTITGITVKNGNGETWSTSNAGNYPLVVAANGSQLNSAYGQTLGAYTTQNQKYSFTLYGQMESKTFSGGSVNIQFSDGQSPATELNAVTYSDSAANTTTSYSGNNMTANMMDALRLANPGLYR